MSDDEFRKLMGDVSPLSVEQRVTLDNASRVDQTSIEARRQLAQEHQHQDDPLGDNGVEHLQPETVLAFCRPGIQQSVYKRFRMGRYAVDASIDLHGMTVVEARQAVYHFVKDCLAHRIRYALITHGNGKGRKMPAVLKSHIASWLPQMPEVLAFHSAQQQHGGTGACYIMLKRLP